MTKDILQILKYMYKLFQIHDNLIHRFVARYYFILLLNMFHVFSSTPVLYLIGQKQCQTISDIIFVTHKYFPHFRLDKTKFSRFATYFFASHENISRL